MKKKIGLLGLALLVAWALIACGAMSEPQIAGLPVEMPMVDEEVALLGKGDAGGGYAVHTSVSDADDSVTANVEQMIIWNANISLIVQDTKEAMGQVQAVASELGGRTIGSESWMSDDQLYVQLTIRVPAEKYEDAMARLRDLALEVNRESASSDDVTDQYVDLESQLRHLEAKEAQLLEFLEDAEDTEAVLAVYDHLASTQAEIEHIKGRMAYLRELSAMATISVELYPEEGEPPVVEEGWKPGRIVRDAARALVNTLEGLAGAIIWFGIYILPILLVIAVPIVLVLRAAKRRRRRRREDKTPPQDQP